MAEAIKEHRTAHDDRGFRSGMTAGMLCMLGASAIHWFITPAAHPNASSAAYVANWAQLVLGFGGSVLLAWRHTRRTRTGRNTR